MKRDGGYPTPLFTTSTRDDRVHQAMRARWWRACAVGQPVLYYENIEGRPRRRADNEQRATLQAIEFTYLWQRLAAGD